MDNYNFWYYTLSTISQTLAALIALSATFAIFKLDQLHRLKKDYIDKMFRFFMILNYKMNIHDVLPKLKSNDGIIELLKPLDSLSPEKPDLGFKALFFENTKTTGLKVKDAEDAFTKCHEYMNIIIRDDYKGKHESNNGRLWGYLKFQQNYYNNLLQVKITTYCRLKYSLLFNSVTIILSLLFIPMFKCLECSLFYIVFIMIILAAYCIFYTGRSMWIISHSDI